MYSSSLVYKLPEESVGITFGLLQVFSPLPGPPARMPLSQGRCPKCNRQFRRLDTHLRVSATCRDVAWSAERPSTPPLQSMNIISTEGNSLSRGTLSGNLNYTTVTASVTKTSPSSVSPDAHFKLPLRLPRSARDWEEADRLLSILPSLVAQAITAEEKNSCLCDGIYNIMAGQFGTRSHPRQHPSSRPKVKQHNRALKEVTRKKNEQDVHYAEQRGRV